MAEADPKLAEDAAGMTEFEATKPRRNWRKLGLMLSLPVALLIGGLVYWQSLQGQVSTDNAYVHLDKVSVSAQVGGQIVEVLVKENQHVKAGDLLFRVDPEPFRLQIAQLTPPLPLPRRAKLPLPIPARFRVPIFRPRAKISPSPKRT